LLVGAYAFDRRLRRYNAAFAVHPDGLVPPPYFKRILIPFGETMPLASLIPRLRGLNARAGAFTAGRQARVFEYPMRRADGAAYTLRVAPLICYEDTVPALSREAARGGAELLVNLTSDSWFGRSAAPRQHHVIASFRAIENRRVLVRSTTTGLSAVVDPLGRTIARIPAFSEGTVKVRVGLLGRQGAYTGPVGDRPWWALLAASLAAMALDRRRGAMRRHGNPSRSSPPGPSRRPDRLEPEEASPCGRDAAGDLPV
jgi:apolipoprotein N-acyltransferase